MRFVMLLTFLIFSVPAFADVQITRVRISGNKAVETSTLQRVSGARRYDFYKEGFCDSIIKRLTRTYVGLGYTEVAVQCKLRESQLLIKITEGKQDKVKSVSVVQGGEEAERVNKIITPITSTLVGRPVFPSVLRDWKRELLYALRTEGYLFSSLQLQLLEGDRLNISINPRNPVQFIISGNNEVTNEDILRLLQISDRLSPITNRAIEELPEQIQQVYADKGYPFAEVQVVEQEAENQIKKFLILINEGEKAFISDVIIESETLPPDIDYQEAIRTRPRRLGPLSWIEPGILNKEKIAADLVSLEEMLRSRGYIEAKADYLLSVTKKGIVVTFEVIPGRQYLVENLHREIECPTEIEHGPIIDKYLEKIQSVIATEENITPQKIAIREELIKLGFPSPITDFTFDKSNSTLDVLIRCGDRQEVGSIEFEGIVHTNKTYLKKLLWTKPGDSIAQLDRGIERIRATGVFSSVDVRLEESTLQPSKPGFKPKDVRIIFRERDTGVLDTSVSINTEDGLRIGGELSQRNFRSKAETLSLNADLFINGGNNLFSAGRAKAFWRVPTVFGKDQLEFLTEGYAQYDIQNVNQFSFNRVGADSQFRLKLKRFTFNIGASVFQDDVYDVRDDVIIGDRDTSKTFYSFLTAKVEFDNRDSELAPTKGFYSALLGKASSEELGAEVNLGLLSAEAKYYLPVSSELVWVNGARGTKIVPYGDTQTVPLSQRLFLGGANSLRGFNRNRVSPLGNNGNRAGGDQSYVLNSELQWNLTDSLQLASFIDAGQVKLENGGDSLASTDSDLRVSPGVGIRYRTPVGPLGIDIGIPWDKRAGESTPRVYFGFNGIF